ARGGVLLVVMSARGKPRRPAGSRAAPSGRRLPAGQDRSRPGSAGRWPCAPPEGGSADRPAVHQAAVAPRAVQATLQLHGARHAQIALEALAVVADRLDDVVTPLVIHAQVLAHARG